MNDSPSATSIFYFIPLHSKKAYQPSHRLVKFFYSPIKSYNILLIITIKRGYNLPSDKLTELGVRKAKSSSIQKKLTDGRGLFLLLHPNGSKYWRMKYRFMGKEKLLAFGVWLYIDL